MRNKIMESNIGKLVENQKKEFSKFQLEFIEKVILFSIAGLGLITALAWDDAFKDLFKLIVGNLNYIQTKFLYAFSLTFLTAIATMLFGRFLKKRRNRLVTK